MTALGRASLPEPDTPSQIVQDVFVPTAEPSIAERPHEATQRFRGQPFVVFSTRGLAQRFSERWIWNAPPLQERKGVEESDGAKSTEIWTTENAVEAATVSGLRSLTK